MTIIDIRSADKDKTFGINCDSQIIPIDTLLNLHNNGFKIVAISMDSKTPAVRSTNEIYYNSDYWSVEKLHRNIIYSKI
jgi:hypothetical protein